METVQERESILKEMQTAVRHTAVYGLGNLLAKAVGFIMIPFYTRYLTPKDYGILEILDLSISLFGMFLSMGMAAALLRCYAAAESADERKKLVSTGLIFVSVTGIVTALVAIRLVNPVSVLLFGPKVPATYLFLSVSSFILSYIATLPRTYLRALEASGTITVLDTISMFILLALNIYFIAVLKLGLVGVLYSTIIVTAVQAVGLSVWIVRKVGLGFSRPQLQQMVRYGWPLVFSNLAAFALNFSDRFFLQHFRGLETVGIYSVGYKFGFMINFLLAQPFLVMWQARMYIIHAQEDHAKIFKRIFVLYVLVLVYAWLALSLVSPEIIHLMVGPKFSSSQYVVPIVALAYVCWGVAFYVQLGMFLMNKTHWIGLISTVAAAVNLALNFLLIPLYGMLGAAWATVLGFLAMAVGSYLLSQRVFPLSLAIGRVSVAFALGIGMYLLSWSWQPASVGVDLLLKALLLAAFPVFVWRFRILPAAEFATLVSAKDHVLARLSRLAGVIPEAR